MFSRDELKNLPDLCGNDYVVIRANGHDVTIKNIRTGHEWIMVSNYKNASCFLLHRHNSRVPFHRQRGRYKSCGDTMKYIKKHDEWVLAHGVWRITPSTSTHRSKGEEPAPGVTSIS